jgi:small subunit ribosomal protein S6
MTNTYEGMFLVDNDLVRADWAGTKSMVTGLLEKHGGTVRSARRWDERALAYPIRGRRRGTFILTFSELPGDRIEALKRDLEITDGVLRYLILRADEVPAEELEFTAAESSAEFELPEVPTDDEGYYSPLQNLDEEDMEDDTDDDDDDDDVSSPPRPRARRTEESPRAATAKAASGSKADSEEVKN